MERRPFSGLAIQKRCNSLLFIVGDRRDIDFIGQRRGWRQLVLVKTAQNRLASDDQNSVLVNDLCRHLDC